MKLVTILFALSAFLAGSILGEDPNDSSGNDAHARSEYADVLALQGTAKEEILAIARLLRAKPEIAIDRTAEAGEFCLKASPATMVHFASNAARTREDIVYQFDASELIKAGLQPERLTKIPSLGEMEPGKWYFLPSGTVDPHHNHAMATPMIVIAADVR